MQVLIFDNQIAGIAPDDQDALNLPSGFTIAEYDGNFPIESLYFSDGEVQVIPTSPPDGNHQWSGSEWVEIPPITLTFITQYGPNWSGLLSDLRGSEVWEKSFIAASTSIAANAAWTLLCSTLTGTNRHLPDLMFSIGALRAAMINSEVGDFTADQVATINTIMVDRGFPEI